MRIGEGEMSKVCCNCKHNIRTGKIDNIVKAELAKYEPYWKKVICIKADV